MGQRYPGIDYDYRPVSYWETGDDALRKILSNVKGTQRRRMIREYWDQGRIDELDETLQKPELAEGERGSLGRIHPTFMGGEYLPPYRRQEVEIARLELESTTADVISIRARPASAGRIRYRIVDEYETGFGFAPRSSSRPLSLDELLKLIDGATGVDGREDEFPGGLALFYNEMNLDGGGGDPGDLEEFTRVASDHYPQLEDHYRGVFSDWVEEKRRDRERPNQ